MSSLSNPSPDPTRDLKSSVPAQGTYSASPSQLTLHSDLPSVGLPNPYQPYAYVPGPHDPSAFGFPPPSYRPHLQAQSSSVLSSSQQGPPPPHHHHPHHHPQQQQSPTNLRKRRASDLLDSSLPGSSAGSYGGSAGLGMSGHDGLDMGSLHHHHPPPPPPPSQQQPPPPHQQQQQSGPPMPNLMIKKGRTNTPWTPAEEQRLKALRDAGSSWSEIAKTFPTRTEGSVKKHWYKDMHYAEFAEDEVSNFSAALLQAIKDYENNKWKVIGQKVGKPAKACEQFAKEQGWKI